MFLVYALWAIALLSIVGLSVVATGNTSYHLAHNAVTATQTEAAVEAAVSRAILALLDPRPEHRWRVDGVPHDFSSGSIEMRVAIQDEFGRIDLNHADQSLLIDLFQSAGLEFPAASSVVDKILDWRDPRPGQRANGAQDADYRSAGFAYSPRGGPFQSVDELKLVMGVTSALYQRVRPALTVYSGRPVFDPQFAPREVLSALSSLNADAVTSIMSARTGQGTRAGIIDPGLARRGRAFSIQIQFRKPESAATRDVVVRLTEDDARPYWVLSWRTK